MTTAKQQYGLNTPFGLVKTKGDERSVEQILSNNSHLIGKRIKVGDSSFGVGSLSDEAVQEYKIVPCSISQRKVESREIITLKWHLKILQLTLALAKSDQIALWIW